MTGRALIGAHWRVVRLQSALIGAQCRVLALELGGLARDLRQLALACATVLRWFWGLQ